MIGSIRSRGSGPVTTTPCSRVTQLAGAYAGSGPEARLDAILVQPEVEWLVLGGAGGGQALARSFATRREVRTLDLAGAARPAPAATTPRAAWSRS